ncbi:HEAT repeat domain-containing protein [Dactylosporangium aurantiacum]|uniref:HEAT repeat domain-containing protein n=1 Tax=Dactylosporangium aurantiacum TaxID=35754 RepID=A0A9Q9ICV5_9ACTN|nr:HEAT repeat domain-containing protein [Dactylosporangium aurantiacum]MDG6103437.1 HEAT repeat domain-containing protein [Dactylosporangium aurantiacum]UWZ52055.1 HEAT repeat domain-containing protein [Dactylosporangium aurantiacum]
MARTLRDLLHAMDAVCDCADPVVDEIEALVAADPAGSRRHILAHPGSPLTRLWALGLTADPADLDELTATALQPPTPTGDGGGDQDQRADAGDRALRHTALVALGNQPDRARVDAVARSLLTDPDPGIRAAAAGIVGFLARPGAADALRPLAADPDPGVRTQVTWRLRRLA